MDSVRANCHRAGCLPLQNRRGRRGWRSPVCAVAAGGHGPKFVDDHVHLHLLLLLKERVEGREINDASHAGIRSRITR